MFWGVNFTQIPAKICQNSENWPVKGNPRIWAIFPAEAETFDFGKIQKISQTNLAESYKSDRGHASRSGNALQYIARLLEIERIQP